MNQCHSVIIVTKIYAQLQSDPISFRQFSLPHSMRYFEVCTQILETRLG
jgi:hypothetical protein